MRKDSKMLPGKEELAAILWKEARRKLLKGKEKAHYPNFSLAIRLFDLYGEYGDIFQKKFRAGVFIEKAKIILDKLVKKILKDPRWDRKKNLFNKIYNYLSEEDKLEKSDLIFVFAAPTLTRVEKAIELYKKGLAPLLVFSGCSPIYQQKENSEAVKYKNFAIAQGVSESSIIVENNSITIPDNVRSSLNLLDKLKIKFKRLILVNSPYVQRRGWVHFKKYLPDGVRVYRVNSSCKPEYTKENWFKNEQGIQAILNEFVKMKIAVILNTG